MSHTAELVRLTREGKIVACFECDAIVTGVADANGDGFVRCPACELKMRRGFGADPIAPAAKGYNTIARRDHRAAFVRRCIGMAERALRKERDELAGAFSSYYRAAAERALGREVWY